MSAARIGRDGSANRVHTLQVVREVAALDNINPGGMYASRVRMLGRCVVLPDTMTAALLLDRPTES